jgi:activator of HSP90 ATPase
LLISLFPTSVCTTADFDIFSFDRVFSKTDGFVRKELLKQIKQRKGEAEMAQVDWLPTMQDDLADNEAVVAVVTCGFPGGFIEICLTHSKLKTSG